MTGVFMINSMESDKRKHLRIKFDGAVNIYPVTQSKSGNIFEVQAKGKTAQGGDISEGGIRLVIQDGNEPKDILKLNFKIKKFKSAEVYAKLVWKKGDTFGMRFILLDDDFRSQIRIMLDDENKQ
jgi:hypothetical protein